MVKRTLGPLTAAEAQAFNDVVGEFVASDGGIQGSSAALLMWRYDTHYHEFSLAAYAPFLHE